jgi:hypothetical protein
MNSFALDQIIHIILAYKILLGNRDIKVINHIKIIKYKSGSLYNAPEIKVVLLLVNLSRKRIRRNMQLADGYNIEC